jgi:uncharacterized protein YbaP (TraB family)
MTQKNDDKVLVMLTVEEAKQLEVAANQMGIDLQTYSKKKT